MGNKTKEVQTCMKKTTKMKTMFDNIHRFIYIYIDIQ